MKTASKETQGSQLKTATALPLTAVKARTLTHIQDANGNCVASCAYDSQAERAAYIVAACNAYPELVAALRALQARVDACELGPVNGGREQADAIAQECAASRALLRRLVEAS